MVMSRFVPLAYLTVLFVPLAGVGNDKPKSPDSENVLEKFTVYKNGDALLVPVTVNGKTFQFVVDTGSSHTVFDSSIPLGEARKTKTVLTPGGPTRIRFFDAPKAFLGTHDLGLDRPVAAFDFSKMREVSDHDFYGVLGMDFLKKHVVQIDFDRGELLLFKALPKNLGQAIDLKMGWDDVPYIPTKVEGLGKVSLLLDSGNVGTTCDLDKSAFQRMVKQEHLRVVSKANGESASGTSEYRIGQAKELSVGSFVLVKPAIGESAGDCLGLEFLARFLVTFDFPESKVYLKTGKLFRRPDRWDLTGLSIIRKQGKAVVFSVENDSPAANAGIKPGDRVLKISDKHADKTKLFELRRLGYVADSQLRLSIGRDKEILEITLKLKQHPHEKQ